jgi:hypothetical protein
MDRALATLSLMLLLSCGKEDAKGGAAGSTASTSPSSPPVASTPPAAPPSPSVAAAASASAAESPPGGTDSQLPAPKCPAGLLGNAFPAYCIKVPPNYKVKQSRISPKRGSIEYDTGTSTDNLMVSYDDSLLAQVSKDVESEMKFGGDKLEKKGDLPGGNKWFRGAHAEYARVVTLFKGQGPLTLKCSFAYQAKKAPAKEAIDACKSLVIP